MDLPRNRLKAALARGDVQIGCWLSMAHSPTAEIAAAAGYDWVLIDAEHGPNDVGSIQAQLIAVEGQGAEAAVRVPSNDAVWLKRVLDLGARSVLVPMVESAAEAEAAVRTCRYPPDGVRGVAGLTRAAGYGAIADYTTRANAEICVIVQAESARAVEQIDAIAAVDGVDAVFIGPADLSASLGHPGRPDHPEVTAAIAHLAARTRAAGKAVGMIGFNPAAIPAMRDAGGTLLAIGSDIVLLSEGLRGRAAVARDLLS